MKILHENCDGCGVSICIWVIFSNSVYIKLHVFSLFARPPKVCVVEYFYECLYVIILLNCKNNSRGFLLVVTAICQYLHYQVQLKKIKLKIIISNILSIANIKYNLTKIDDRKWLSYGEALRPLNTLLKIKNFLHRAKIYGSVFRVRPKNWPRSLMIPNLGKISASKSFRKSQENFMRYLKQKRSNSK